MLLGAAAVWALAAAPADVSQWVKAFEQPTLGAPVDAAGRELAWGHVRLKLTSGRLHAVRVGGETAGVYFTGAGQVRYLSEDTADAPIFRRNAEVSTDYRVDATGALEDGFSDALVLSSGTPDDVTSAPGEAPRETVEALAAHRARFAHDMTPPYATWMTQARMHPPAQPLVMAEIQGARHDLFYIHDTLRHHEESIGILERIKLPLGIGASSRARDRSFERLSRQPVGRARLTVAPIPWTLREVDATFVNPRGQQLEVESKQVFEAHRALRALDLFLPQSLMGELPSSAGPRYALESVVDATGRALPFARAGDDLLVELPTVLEAGQRIELTFRMSGNVLVRPFGDNYWSAVSWYPGGSDGRMDSYRYHAVVKVPAPFTAFSSGATVKRWSEGTLNCVEFREPNPVAYVFVVAGKYTTYVDARPDLTVRVSSYGLAKEGASKQIAGLVHAFVAFYQPLLGKLRFRELDVLEINAEGFGIAPPGMIFITREAFTPLADHMTQHFVKGVNARLAHEVAHAWWGHGVRPAGLPDRWMSESLAEYYSGLAMQLRDRKDFGRMLDGWKDEAKPVRSRGSVYLAHASTGEDAFRDRYALLYAKGPLVLHALRLEIGDQAFFTVFKSLLSSFPIKHASTADVIAITNLVTKKDYGPWFERYLIGSEWPPLEKPKGREGG